MADFVQTMKNWRRMCKHYSDEGMKDEQLSCVDVCPLGHNTACGIIEDALDSDVEDAAKEIAKWAAEHPEPVYPTWGEYLCNIGLIHDCENAMEMGRKLFHSSIPADIAQKLGVEPKK